MTCSTRDPVSWPGHDRPLGLLRPLGRPADLDLRPAPARTPRLTEDSTVLYQAGTGATGNGGRGPGLSALPGGEGGVRVQAGAARRHRDRDPDRRPGPGRMSELPGNTFGAGDLRVFIAPRGVQYLAAGARVDVARWWITPEGLHCRAWTVADNGLERCHHGHTRSGPYPYCRYMRHRVFSVTKSLGAAVALLRLAAKYGDGVFDLKIADYVWVTATHDGWTDATFAEALSMVVPIGDVAPRHDSQPPGADDFAPKFFAWIVKRTAQEKLDQGFTFGKYAWARGEVVRYNIAVTFTLAAAMDAFLKGKEGPNASLWDMVADEVYDRSGSSHPTAASTARSAPASTWAAGGSRPTACTAVPGMSPTAGASAATTSTVTARCSRSTSTIGGPSSAGRGAQSTLAPSSGGRPPVGRVREGARSDEEGAEKAHGRGLGHLSERDCASACLMRGRKVVGGMLVLLGILSLWEGWRLHALRTQMVAGAVVGDDTFPFIVGAALVVLGASILFVAKPPQVKVARPSGEPRTRMLLGAGVLAAYWVIVPYLGYTVSTPRLHRALPRHGRLPWPVALLLGGVTTGALYLVFRVWLLEPLPTGWLGTLSVDVLEPPGQRVRGGALADQSDHGRCSARCWARWWACCPASAPRPPSRSSSR